MGEPLDRPEEDQPPLPAEQNGQLTLWLGQAVWLWIPAQISPSWPRSTLVTVGQLSFLWRHGMVGARARAS